MENSCCDTTKSGAYDTSATLKDSTALLGPAPHETRVAIKKVIEAIYEFTKHESPALKVGGALIAAGLWPSELDLEPQDVSLVQARGLMTDLVERLLVHLLITQPTQARARKGECATAAMKARTLLSLTASAVARMPEQGCLRRVTPETLSAATALLNDKVQPLAEKIRPWNRAKRTPKKPLSPEEEGLRQLAAAHKSIDRPDCLLQPYAAEIEELRRKGDNEVRRHRARFRAPQLSVTTSVNARSSEKGSK